MCDVHLFYFGSHLVATSLILPLIPCPINCFCWISRLMGESLCSSLIPNIHLHLVMDVSCHNACRFVRSCISFVFLVFFFLFSSFVTLMLVFLFSFRQSIISFIASVVDLTRFSICRVCASVRVAVGSSIASACSWIAFAENCFAVSLFCLFFLAYSIEMKVIMFGRVLLAVGFCSHSRTVALNSPVAFKWYSAMSLCSFNLS